MLGVYLSIKTNSLTGRNISLFTVFDLSSPLTQCFLLSTSMNKMFKICICDIFITQWKWIDLEVKSWQSNNHWNCICQRYSYIQTHVVCCIVPDFALMYNCIYTANIQEIVYSGFSEGYFCNFTRNSDYISMGVG